MNSQTTKQIRYISFIWGSLASGDLN